MLQVLEQALAYGQKQQADRLAGPGLDLRRAASARPRRRGERHHPPVPSEEFEKPELLRLEKETLGLYVSEHPLSSLRAELRAKTDATIAELERRRDGENVVVGGIVSEVKQLTTKRGEQMVFLRLDDVTGGIDCVVFAAAYAAAAELCVADRIVIVKGRVDHKEGETKLIAQEISAFESVAAQARRCASGSTRRRRAAGIIGELATLLRDYPGREPGARRLRHLAGPARAPARAAVPRRSPTPDFYAEVRALLGESALA